MPCDVPCMSYMALYVISTQIINSNSRSQSHSNHWKLNVSAGKVEPVKAQEDTSTDNNSNNTHSKDRVTRLSSSEYSESYNDDDVILPSKNRKKNNDDEIMQIITNKVPSREGWVVKSERDGDDDLIDFSGPNFITSSKKIKTFKPKPTTGEENSNRGKSKKKSKLLSCGRKVNFTIYDDLRGVSERLMHPYLPEPDVAMVFKSSGKSSEVDMYELEQRLRKARRDVEKSKQTQQSAQVYNLIGNFWRIKGNTHIAIECFRKSLSISPEDPDILLNLARVLFNLQYLDDAIFLARRSLHLQSPASNSWLQHFTLGEILKSYGHSAEAAMHFNQALELNPGFQPAKSQLREVAPSPSVTHFTLFIIIFLVVGVLVGIITSMDGNFQGAEDGSKSQQRHFNRAMAMRSIKMGINPRLRRGASS